MKAIKTVQSKAEKKLMRFALLASFLLSLLAVRAHAQIDPSSAMLLNANSSSVRDGGLDSGRYTVKPKTEIIHSTQTRKTETKTRVEEIIPSPAMPVADPSVGASPAVTPSTVTPPTAAVVPSATPTVIGPQSPLFGPEKDESENEDEPVVQKIPRDERRFTMLELSFAPGYLYNESKSTFSPRNYIVSSPAMGLDASLWISPNFGLHTGFEGTINANVTDSYNDTKNAAVTEQWFSIGAHTRRFFGDGALSPTLQFGLDYREFQFGTPSDTVYRNKLSTNGLILLLDAEFPTSSFGAWNFGGEFGPKLSHHETSNSFEFRSGTDPQTSTVAVHVGSRYQFDHSNQIFWKVTYGIERDLYGGSTTINDPLTNLPQSNVSITNSFTLFQLGYTWRN